MSAQQTPAQGVITQIGNDIDGEADGTRLAVGAPSNAGGGSGSGHEPVCFHEY